MLIALLLCTVVDVQQTADDSFPVRRAASARLDARPLASLPAALAGSLSRDPERRRRCARVMEIARLRVSWGLDDVVYSLPLPTDVVALYLLDGPDQPGAVDWYTLSPRWSSLLHSRPDVCRAVCRRLWGWDGCQYVPSDPVDYHRARVRGVE